MMNCTAFAAIETSVGFPLGCRIMIHSQQAQTTREMAMRPNKPQTPSDELFRVMNFPDSPRRVLLTWFILLAISALVNAVLMMVIMGLDWTFMY